MICTVLSKQCFGSRMRIMEMAGEVRAREHERNAIGAKQGGV